MREILFRGKRLDNGEWLQGDFNKWQKTAYIMADNSDSYAKTNYLVAPATVGQYTGLTDKNGKKIFEGDCWIDTDGGDYLAYVVEFRDGQFGFACYGIRGMMMPYGYDDEAGGWGEIDFTPFTDYYIDEVEIIGNIHDNPELIGGADNG